MAIELLTGVLLGTIFGLGLAWLGLRSRSAGMEARLSVIEKDLAAARGDLAGQ